MTKPPRRVQLTGNVVATPGIVRMSSALRRLRASGAYDSADHVEALAKLVGDQCPTHGKLDDPVLAIAGDEVAFACPWCSSPEILRMWEVEAEPQ